MTAFEIVADVALRLQNANIPYCVGGSLASSTWGQMRQTNDADVAILLASESEQALITAFGEPYLLSLTDLEAALVSSAPFRAVQLTHMDEAFKIDLFVLRPDECERSELDRARDVEVIPGSLVRVAAPENIVLAKLRWFILGNRASDRQWNDIVSVLEIQAGKLDIAYLDRWALHFGVNELLEAARRQAR